MANPDQCMNLTIQILTVKEAAHILRVDAKTVYRQLRCGRLSGDLIGTIWRVYFLDGRPLPNKSTRRELDRKYSVRTA